MYNLNISIPSNQFKHIDGLSSTNTNFYEIIQDDNWYYGDFDMLREKYNSALETYEYTIGKMISNKFQGFMYWLTDESIFE